MTWYEFVCLLLLFSGAARANGISHQWPERITVTEGGTAQLNCAYISNINVTKKWVGSLTWYKDEENGTVCNKCSGFHGRVTTNSSQGFLNQTLQIVNVRMNDTGKYYCKVQIFDKGSYLGKGTEVQVTMVAELFPNERKIVLYVSPLLVSVLLALALIIIIIYRKRCARSTDKESTTQAVPKKEKSVVYAEINMRKAPRTRPLDYVACESGRTGRSSQAGKREDPILYAEVRAASPRNDWASTKPTKSPRREEQIVYAAVNV
ncbi:T-cell immunoreceptor with Ig and ITIM domains-like isoform X1 [Mobula hypostoma]|uniref:T-cell immunoreceptor with Ig and ITIM domains-like isoform X1 n=1 Tax=Mobula hypostoma TaxID=723540 RepID=UPI002FC28854